MRTKFIKIKDISEIDTSRITIHDLHNRYIDACGNMYGLKYNRNNRKVEIIKIIRTPVKSADYYRQIIRQVKRDGVNKKDDKSYFEVDETLKEELKDDENYAIEESDEDFNAELFIEESVELLGTHSARLEGIMKNIKNSRVIPEGDRINSAQLADIFRNIDIDGIQRIEKILSNHKEIKEYPRSLSYYIAKQNTKNMEIIDQLDSDTTKMKFIYFAEMYYSMRSLYRILQKVLKDLFYFVENTNPDEMRDLTYAEKQNFQDAKLSIDSTLLECEKVTNNIKKLDAYLENIDNF